MDQRVTPGQIINTLKPGAFVTLAKVPHGGSLEARRLAAGVRLYWRITADKKTDRVAIGIYDPAAPPKSLKPTKRGLSIAAALQVADETAKRHTETAGGHRAVVEQARLDKLAADAKAAAQVHTVENLFTDYCKYLEKLGRKSHREALNIFKLHVFAAWPKVAALPSHEATGDHVADMMRALIQAGKGRTANKLRSYARAAFQIAKAARSKPSIPAGFKNYGISINPVAETEPDTSQNLPDKHPLRLDELRTYWQTIKPLPGIKGALLRLHLLTGGQRIEQLVALRTADIRDESIVLHDGKGRPGRPARPHEIPLIKPARAALLECKPQGHYALSTDGGETHIANTTLSAWAVAAAGETIPDFKAKRIRSGVETALAAAQVSEETRGRLQSHGISGVQNKHYNGYEYMAEKREALNILFKLLQTKK